MKSRDDNDRIDSIRTFVAIDIPDSIKAEIAKLQSDLKEIGAAVSWTRPANIHLTLKFLGGVRSDKISGVISAAERASNGVTPFEIEISGAGCFPSIRSPRVLWVGISKVTEPLQRLYSNLEQQLSHEGFEREKRKFSPHLTIGRVRNQENAARLAEELSMLGFSARVFKASEIIVMRSQLKPTGSVYTPQAIIPLSD